MMRSSVGVHSDREAAEGSAESVVGVQHEPPFPYRVRPCEPRDQDAILALLRLTVGETSATKKTAEFWRWKHAENPFGASFSVCACDAADEVVALRSMMRWNVRDRSGARFTAVRPVDTATHPEHQRRGIFSALTRFAVEELGRQQVPFIFNTPNANSLPGYLKIGWQVVARWPLYMRPVSWFAFGSKVLLRRGTAGERAPVGPAGSAGGLTSWQDFSQRHQAELPSLIAAHESLRRQVGYRTERTLEYLDWRYGAHPDIEYLVHGLVNQERLTGFVVARRVRGIAGSSCLVVTELFLRNPTPREARRLLKSLVCAKASDYLVAHFAPGTIERQALFRTGFVRAPGRGYTFAARALNRVPDDPALPGSWDLTLGELEIF